MAAKVRVQATGVPRPLTKCMTKLMTSKARKMKKRICAIPAEADSNATEPEQSGDQGHDQKYQGIIQHRRFSTDPIGRLASPGRRVVKNKQCDQLVPRGASTAS